ncbi:MAG: hypothetical protein JWO13_195 [Acidobacteriales bacterium]|nr:hypothetical protein [Terriglobales bacterium]
MAATSGAATAGPLVGGAPRLNSVDLLRGLVMAIMALDHTRDYFTYVRFAPENLAHTYGSLFFTRWITHFCAPTFFFLAGTGAYLSKKRGAELSNFLWKRGLWLVFLELTLISFAWTFSPLPSMGFLVIWALGWAMVFLAILVRLPLKAIAIISVSMIVLHNAFDTVSPAAFGKLSWLWLLLHKQGFYPIGQQFGFFVLYPLIPWIGVMGAGYAFGALLQKPAEQRRRTLLIIGASMIVLFVILRATNIYGDPPAGFGTVSPGPFVVQKTTELTVISFFDVEKYPPSLQYLLMTLGPAIMLLAWFEKVNLRAGIGKFWDKILVFGRVPMFYYILHLFLIHAMAIAVAVLFRQPAKWLIGGAFFNGPAIGYGHGLAFVYLMWLLAVFILYFPCKWYAGVKERRKDWWLSYV